MCQTIFLRLVIHMDMAGNQTRLHSETMPGQERVQHTQHANKTAMFCMVLYHKKKTSVT